MVIEYRQITSAEHRRFGLAVERGFGGHYEPSHDRFELDKRTLTPEMTICAFDDGEIVGTSGAFPFESVSGEAPLVPVAGPPRSARGVPASVAMASSP